MFGSTQLSSAFVCKIRTKRSSGESFSPTGEFSRMVPLLSACSNTECYLHSPAQIQEGIVATAFDVRGEHNFMGVSES